MPDTLAVASCRACSAYSVTFCAWSALDLAAVGLAVRRLDGFFRGCTEKILFLRYWSHFGTSHSRARSRRRYLVQQRTGPHNGNFCGNPRQWPSPPAPLQENDHG